MEAPSLLINLVFALGAAMIGAALAAWLRQSVILGYILAGVLIGPFTPGFVGDIAAVQALADIGIIFLLFAIGVHLSIRDLLRVGRLATAGGLAQVMITIGIGYLVGVAIGWAPQEALFLGAVVSISSTMVLGHVLGERGEVDSAHGRISLAWGTVQDFSTIVLVVVLSALAAGGQTLGVDLVWALGKAALFLVLAASLGVSALPWFFNRVAALQNREVFVLAVAGVALGTAYASSFFGLSLALGAFVAGIVVSESDLSHQILGTIMPLRDIFAGLFFVSVGMLINPIFVAENVALVLLILALIVPVKGALTAVLTALAGSPLRTAVLIGVALAQSAEFSFLLARLGVAVGALTPEHFSLMMAAAAASIVVFPLLQPAAVPLISRLEARLPLSKLAAYPEWAIDTEPELRGHAVICGYGRVGRVIGSVLRRRGFRFVVVEQDQQVVRWLREHGIVALLGNAANPVLLERTHLERARVLVVAIPDPLAARQIVDYARQGNPRLDMIVRAHSAAERDFLYRHGVREVVLSEVELALEMMRHTLHRFGVSSLETQAVVQNLRERLGREPQDQPAPELSE